MNENITKRFATFHCIQFVKNKTAYGIKHNVHYKRSVNSASIAVQNTFYKINHQKIIPSALLTYL